MAKTDAPPPPPAESTKTEGGKTKPTGVKAYMCGIPDAGIEPRRIEVEGDRLAAMQAFFEQAGIVNTDKEVVITEVE